MAKAPKEEPTLVEKWWRAIYNNPLAAGLIIIGSIVVATLGVFKALPDGAQSYAISFFAPKPVATNGWAYVGNLDARDDLKWVSDPRVEMVRQSPAADREYPFRAGDRVRPLRRVPQVIIDFKDHGMDNVLTKPTSARGTINPEQDYTKAYLEVGTEYDVMDIDVNGFRGKDRVMWLRLSK
jgi:hypothetical protein